MASVVNGLGLLIVGGSSHETEAMSKTHRCRVKTAITAGSCPLLCSARSARPTSHSTSPRANVARAAAHAFQLDLPALDDHQRVAPLGFVVGPCVTGRDGHPPHREALVGAHAAYNGRARAKSSRAPDTRSLR
jgi:hypothetical protein